MRILFLGHLLERPGNDRSVLEKRLSAYASPGTTIEVDFPDRFPGSQLAVESGEFNMVLRQMRIPELMRKIFLAEQNGYDAVIQSNTYDPGVEAGRLVVKIPVIGLLRTALHTGLNLSDRIGIMIAGNTPLADLERHVWRILRSYRLDHAVSGIRGLEGAYVDTVQGNKQAVFDTAVSAIKRLVAETGAEIILPLGGAIIPYTVDPRDLEEATGVQVLNTKAIGISFAETCVKLGLTHSPIAYPRVSLAPADFELPLA